MMSKSKEVAEQLKTTIKILAETKASDKQFYQSTDKEMLKKQNVFINHLKNNLDSTDEIWSALTEIMDFIIERLEFHCETKDLVAQANYIAVTINIINPMMMNWFEELKKENKQ